MPVIVDTSPEAPTQATAMGVSSWANTASTVFEWASNIPGWAYAGALAITLTATLVAFPALRRQAYKAGQRTAGKATPATRQDLRDRRLLAAALGPAVLFWLAVLIGSARGLTAFGRDDLGWTGGWEYLVPFTLDGVAVSFGVLAFRAVAKERRPDRARRIVWVATGASAGINFLHEASLTAGSLLAAGYLSILSLFGMLIFHEFLAQFEDGAAWIKRVNPKFGLRWATWPTNTACAWLAWRNYPPADGTDATVLTAVQHLEQVRADKAARRASQVDTFPWWTNLTPWVQLTGLRAALDQGRDQTAAQRARHTQAVNDMRQLAHEHSQAVADLTTRHEEQAETARAETAARVAQVQAERDAHVARLNTAVADLEQRRAVEAATAADLRKRLQATTENRDSHLRRVQELAAEAASTTASKTERIAALQASLSHSEAEVRNLWETFRSQTEALQTEHAEAVQRLNDAHAEKLAEVRAEAATTKLADYRGRTSGGGPKRPTKTPPKPRLSDEAAVHALLAHDSDTSREWTQADIVRVLGVGWGRAPRLLEAVTEELGRRSSGGSAQAMSEATA